MDARDRILAAKVNDPPMEFGDPSEYVRSISLIPKIWRAVKWVTLCAVTVFGAGTAWASFQSALVTRGDLQDLWQSDTLPKAAETRITSLETRLIPLEDGIDLLVARAHREDRLKAQQIEVEEYRREYQEALQEWSAKRAVSKVWKAKPRRSPAHVEAEAKLKRLQSIMYSE